MNGCQRNLTTFKVPWCSLETFQTLNLAPGVQISQGLPNFFSNLFSESKNLCFIGSKGRI